MTVFLAVVLCVVLRALMAGYGGSWFAAADVKDAFAAAWPFLAIAGIERLGSRLVAGSRAPALAATFAMWTVAVASFTRGWVELHTSLAEALALGSGLNPWLAAAGLACGGIAALTHARRSQGATRAALVAAIGWMLVGPDVYVHFDHVEASRRALVAVLVAGGFVAVFALLARLDRRGPHVLCVAIAGAAAAVIVSTLAAPGPRPGAKSPSILLVVVDTLRADALERRSDSGRLLMPRLAEIAAAGVRFSQAVSPAPWTLPSIASALSGMNPLRHHVGKLDAAGVPQPGVASASWLPASLRDAGYLAVAFVNNPWLRRFYGFGPGFSSFGRYHGRAANGVSLALDWLRQHRSLPAFVFLHLMDPHWPYDAPAGFGDSRQPCAECADLRTLQYGSTSVEVRAEVRRRYDAETEYTDSEIGRLWDGMRANGSLDGAWVLIVADHGEEFWEHYGFLHGHTLYDELLRVPLIVVPPLGDRRAPRGSTVGEQVRLEDVGATIANIAGVSAPVAIDGVSLLAQFLEAPADATAAGVTDVRRRLARPLVASYLQQASGQSWAVRASGFKLIASSEVRFPWLFDLANDAGERTPVTFERPYMTAALVTLAHTMGLDVATASPSGGPGAATPSAAPGGDLRRELRSLGYLQ